MVNETKVKLMTKAARIKKNDKRGTFNASHFFGDDYVSFQVLKAVIGVTFGFVLIAGLWFAENAEVILTSYSVQRLITMASGLLLIYVVVVLASILISILVYTSRFWDAKDSIREYQNTLKKIERIYQKEEKERKN